MMMEVIVVIGFHALFIINNLLIVNDYKSVQRTQVMISI